MASFYKTIHLVKPDNHLVDAFWEKTGYFDVSSDARGLMLSYAREVS